MFLFMPILAFADAVEINGIYYELISKSKEAWVTKNPNNYSGEIIIPESINYEGIDYKVTLIRKEAFDGCRELYAISIPNTIVEIGEYAFRGCGIANVIIPESVRTVGVYCFSTCNNLVAATLPNSIALIPNGTFYACDNLESISIPESVKCIGESAFHYCI